MQELAVYEYPSLVCRSEVEMGDVVFMVEHHPESSEVSLEPKDDDYHQGFIVRPEDEIVMYEGGFVEVRPRTDIGIAELRIQDYLPLSQTLHCLPPHSGEDSGSMVRLT